MSESVKKAGLILSYLMINLSDIGLLMYKHCVQGDVKSCAIFENHSEVDTFIKKLALSQRKKKSFIQVTI